MRLGDAEERSAEDREQQQHEAAQQPQQRIAFHQPPLAHQLENHGEQGRRQHDRDDLDARVHQSTLAADTAAGSPGETEGRARKRPMRTASVTLIM